MIELVITYLLIIIGIPIYGKWLGNAGYPKNRTAQQITEQNSYKQPKINYKQKL